MANYPKLPDAPSSVGRVCVDLDGTLAEGQWPSPRIGKPIGKGIAILLFYANQGREIVVYTARPESHKERVWAWLRLTGLQDSVYDVVCGKVLADLYVDDRAYNPFEAPPVQKFVGPVDSRGWQHPVPDEGESGLDAPPGADPGFDSPAPPPNEDEWTAMGYVNG